MSRIAVYCRPGEAGGVHGEGEALLPGASALSDDNPGGTLRIDILGEFTARLDDQVLELGGRRQRAVLAILLLARGSIVPADHLIDSLWGGEATAGAAGALQAYVSHLRRRLEPGRTARARSNRIVSKGTGYALRVDDDDVDVWRFERLVRAAGTATPADAAANLTAALSMWRGPVLAEYATEAWAQAETARVSELRHVAREQLAAARLTLGETSVLVPELEALVAEDPLREERWRLLILALYRARRQGDALAALRRARQTLADELGIDPGPALRAIEAEVLAQSPTLEAPPTTEHHRTAQPAHSPPPAELDEDSGKRFDAALPRTRPGVPAGQSDHDLVDRVREVADLRELIGSALRAEGRLVLVEGPAGIGKSRLLAEARRLLADEDALLLVARGSQLEREFAFGAVRQLFEPALTDPQLRTAAMVGAAGSASVIFDVPAHGDAEVGDRSFAILHGLYWLCVNLSAQRPLVLIVDDIQWCDIGSLRFLAYLARRLEGLPILVLASLRTGEQHEDALIADLQHDVGTALIRPGPLSTLGVGSLVRERLGESADELFVQACHRTTSGNPLLVRQLLRALEAEGVRPDASHADTVTAIGSRAVSSMVLMRLARLPAAAATAAAAIAVLGDGQSLPIVAALAELTESEAAAAIGALARAEVVRNEYPLGFVHPLVRDAVYRNILPGERELQHERAARVLHRGGGTPEQIAAHLLQIPCRGDAWTVGLLRRAATMAGERGAAEGAVAYLARALAEPPPETERAEVLIALGRAQAPLDGPAAAGHLREAYALTTDPAHRAQLAIALAFTLIFAGDRGEATAFARQAAEALPDEQVDERQALMALERISGYMQVIDHSVWQRGEVPAPVGTGVGARMLSTVRAWEQLITGTGREESIEHARFTIDGVADLVGADPGLFWAVAGMVLNLADADVGPLWDDMLKAAHARGALFTVMTVRLWRGFELWRHGDLPEAYQLALTAADQSEAWGANNFGVPYGQSFMMGILLDQGDLSGAREVLDRTKDRPRFGDGACLYEHAYAKVLIAEGRYQQALARLDIADRIRPRLANPAWMSPRRLRAEALLGLGRREEAAEALELELTAARQWGAASVTGHLLRILGEARGPEGLPLVREAVAMLEPAPARLEYARALYSYATGLLAHDRAGALADAVTALFQALEIAHRSGARGLHSDVLAALAAAGVEADPEPMIEPLTTSERRIASMLVDGADELQIAQRLFLTPRAVRSTITSIKDRLGVETVTQLRPLVTGASAD